MSFRARWLSHGPPLYPALIHLAAASMSPPFGRGGLLDGFRSGPGTSVADCPTLVSSPAGREDPMAKSTMTAVPLVFSYRPPAVTGRGGSFPEVAV